MKKIILLLCFLPLSVWALDRPQLDKMLATAAAATGKSYLETRKGILDFGKDVLPLLVQAATDSKLMWQQRLVARICYERISRGEDIEALRRYDWRKNPQYDKQWEQAMVGVRVGLGNIAIPKCVDEGLWYYYIELAWKDTDEYAVEPFNPINDTRILQESWLGWCIASLERRPEHYYLTKVLIERLKSDPSLSDPIDVQYYRWLLEERQSEAVPVLVELYDAYNKREVRGPEVFRGAYDITYRGMFEPILAFADKRHVDLIEKFIAEKPALAPLKDKLAEVRKCPIPLPSKEPSFRLGRQLITP